MKKLLYVVLALSLCLLLSACGATAEETETAAQEETSQVVSSESGQNDEQDEQEPASQNSDAAEDTEQTPQGSEDENSLEDLAGLDVEQNLFDVEITIPASFLGEEITQEDLTKEAEESGFQSATLNEDGSATYVMTHAQHEEMMAGIRESIDQSLADMIDPDVYPSFVSVEANEDYSEFAVTISSDEVGLVESMSVLAFYVYGGMYHAFNGTEVDDIIVSFVNADTGAIIETAHSSAMAE